MDDSGTTGEGGRWLNYAELAASFAARRCECGAPATVVLVGTDEVREVGIMLKRAQPDRNLCSTHAGWLSEEKAAA